MYQNRSSLIIKYSFPSLFPDTPMGSAPPQRWVENEVLRRGAPYFFQYQSALKDGDHIYVFIMCNIFGSGVPH